MREDHPPNEEPSLTTHMNDYNPSRREFMAATGALAAVWMGTDPAAFAAALRDARDAARGGLVQFQALTPEQAEDLDAIAAQIIPTDDLPGAREAGAVVFIDRALATFQSGQKSAMLEGLADLNRRAGGRFSAVSENRQRELLQEIEDTPFFRQVRFGVVTGTFAHPSWGGNADGAGWRILGFEPRYLWRPPFGAYDAEQMGR